MKTCPNCGQYIVDDDPSVSSPAEALADILIESTSTDRLSDLCPSCRQELGMLNLMGFEE